MSADNIKILTIGAATQDVFLTGKTFTAKRDVRSHDYVEQFPLGAKLDVEQVHFATGGGAHNAAITFARQGFRTGWLGKIGCDPAGAEVLRISRKEGIAAEAVAIDPKLVTGYTAILLAPSGERVILHHRGASHNLQAHDFNINHLEADWFYITSLGNLGLLAKLLQHAKSKSIRVAINPGAEELTELRKLRKLLPLVTVLLGNREEMAQLLDSDDLRTMLQRGDRLCPYAVVTDGPKGCYVAASGKAYGAGQYQKVKVVDRTGAGDSFGSGFVAGLALGGDVIEAISLGSANSTAVVQQVGANAGILRSGRVKRMKVRVTKL